MQRHRTSNISPGLAISLLLPPASRSISPADPRQNARNAASNASGDGRREKKRGHSTFLAPFAVGRGVGGSPPSPGGWRCVRSTSPNQTARRAPRSFAALPTPPPSPRGSRTSTSAAADRPDLRPATPDASPSPSSADSTTPNSPQTAPTRRAMDFAQHIVAPLANAHPAGSETP
jgi:hypothetical protein